MIITKAMKRPMYDRQVINVLDAIDREWVRFHRRWTGFSRIDHTAKPGKIASPYHIKWLIGAGLVEPRARWTRSWIYRLTPLGKKLLDES